jgi:hypothetical protein
MMADVVPTKEWFVSNSAEELDFNYYSIGNLENKENITYRKNLSLVAAPSPLKPDAGEDRIQNWGFSYIPFGRAHRFSISFSRLPHLAQLVFVLLFPLDEGCIA